MAKKNQSERLTLQHKTSHGVVGIFGNEAKLHDLTVGQVSQLVLAQLKSDFPDLSFRYRDNIRKEEINSALQKVDKELGQNTLCPEFQHYSRWRYNRGQR